MAFQGFLRAGISQGLWNLTNSPIHLPIYPSIHPFIHPSIHPFTYMHESALGSAEQIPCLQHWGKRTQWWLREVLPVHWDQQVCLKCSGGSLWGQLIFKNHTVVWAPWHLAILWTRKCFFPYGGCLASGSGEGIGWGGDLQRGRDWGCLAGAQVVFVNRNFLVNFLQLSRQPLGNHGT